MPLWEGSVGDWKLLQGENAGQGCRPSLLEVGLACGIVVVLVLVLSSLLGSFSPEAAIEVGARPHFLAERLDDDSRASPPIADPNSIGYKLRLKRLRELAGRLLGCSGPFFRSDRSVSHRGAPLQIPEHTLLGYKAAARMGAGFLECDTAFTKDGEPICRHSVCDLHYTTDLLSRPDLASRCRVPFSAATNTTPARAECCTTDFALAELKPLCAKMEMQTDPSAASLNTFLRVPAWRTTLYSDGGCAPLVSSLEYLRLAKSLGVKMTPELKHHETYVSVLGLGKREAARRFISLYIDEGVPPDQVHQQSFEEEHVTYWQEETEYTNSVMLYQAAETPEGSNGWDDTYKGMFERLLKLKNPIKFAGVPLNELMVADDEYGGSFSLTAPSLFFHHNSIKIVAWTLERSGAFPGGWYYWGNTGGDKAATQGHFGEVVRKDADVLLILDALFQDVGIESIFSDWPATVTFYVNCALER